jgi:hypothetical protein
MTVSMVEMRLSFLPTDIAALPGSNSISGRCKGLVIDVMAVVVMMVS